MEHLVAAAADYDDRRHLSPGTAFGAAMMVCQFATDLLVAVVLNAMVQLEITNLEPMLEKYDYQLLKGTVCLSYLIYQFPHGKNLFLLLE